jgi:hypothetical protein
MSWSLFKSNVLRKTNPNTNPSINIDEVATVWSDEYDACVKRGRDFINLETIQSGNKEIMKTLFRVALLKGLTTPPGVNFSMVNEFGNGVRAYWTGAQMRPFPIPLIPSPGSIQNISVNSNVVINTGTWPLYPPIRPASDQKIIIDMFILAAVAHLFSVGGIIQTTSLYPSVPTPIPAPGVISWTGYIVPPSIKIPNINFPSIDGSEPPFFEQSDDEIQLNGDALNQNNGQDLSDSDLEQLDVLRGNTTLENVINTSLPADITNALDVDTIVNDFKNQIRMGGTKCE